ncbi:MAG: Hsp70 family protein [Gloeobacterales cyanobacterium]
MYSLDFGTTNTLLGRWINTNQPETLILPGLSIPNLPMIPSLLYVHDAQRGKVSVGHEVIAQGLDNSSDPRFFSNFKRGIGSSVQGFTPILDGEEVTFEQVGSWFLQRVLGTLAQQENTLEDLVLTVPVNSFEPYRFWLTGIAQSLSAAKIQLLDESTAAALGYGLRTENLMLVIDFGGGTLDLTLIQPAFADDRPVGFLVKWGQKVLGQKDQRTPIAKVLAKVGLNLGGTDVDVWLADDLAKEHDIRPPHRLQRLAEQIKVRLSSEAEVEETFAGKEDSTTLTYSRQRLEQLLTTQGFFDQLSEAVERIHAQARQRGIEEQDLTAVLLVGGTALIPSVQEWVRQKFPTPKIYSDRPFDAVVQGALHLGRGFKQVQDFLYNSYGIRYWDHKQACHNWHPLFKSGTPYPTAKAYELVLGASVSSQPSIELVIGEWGNSREATEVFFDGTRLVTRKTSGNNPDVRSLNDTEEGRTIARLEPLGFPGKDRIKVLFRVDEQKTLRITVSDLETQKVLLEDTPVVELS